MGPAIESLRPALGVTRRNPALLAAAFVSLVVSGLTSLVVGLVPVVGDVVNTVLVAPAFAALLIGMALAGLASEAASFADGVESVKANYRSLVGAYALLLVGVVAVAVAWAVEVAVVLVLGTAGDRSAMLAAGDPAAIASNGAVLWLTFLALGLALVGGIAVQFFDVAIVVGGASAVASFGASWRLLRERPASVLGYSALRMAPVVLAVVVVGVAYAAGTAYAGGSAGAGLAVVVGAVVGPPVYAFITAYHVVYYDARVGPNGARGGRRAVD